MIEEDVRIEDIDHKLNMLDFEPVSKLIPLNSTLLDVGCGKGTFLLWLKKYRPDVKGEGVDINVDYVNYARSRGLNVRVGDAQYLDYPPDSFDVVTSFHTLEHLEDDRKALIDFIRISKKLVILVLPKTIVRLNQVYGVTKYHYIPFYTPLTLKRLLKNIPSKVMEHYNPTGVYESWLIIIEK